MELFKSFILGAGSVAFIFWIYWAMAYPEEVRDILLFSYWAEGKWSKLVTVVLWAHLLLATSFLGLISLAIVGRGFV